MMKLLCRNGGNYRFLHGRADRRRDDRTRHASFPVQVGFQELANAWNLARWFFLY
jgi:hypothetical protein